jgi:hypothetical protein
MRYTRLSTHRASRDIAERSVTPPDELGSIDVMRLDRTPVASRCLRIKLYFDLNFP